MWSLWLSHAFAAASLRPVAVRSNGFLAWKLGWFTCAKLSADSGTSSTAMESRSLPVSQGTGRGHGQLLRATVCHIILHYTIF